MKQITIRELKSRISSLLKELPIEIVDGKSKKVLGYIVSKDSSPVAEALQKRLDDAVAVFRTKQAYIEELESKVASLEKNKGTLSLGIGGEVKGNDALKAFLNKMANKPKPSESLGRCQAPFCKAEAVEVATYYYFEDELKSIPNRRLCKKHLDLSNNNTPIDRGETKIVPI